MNNLASALDRLGRTDQVLERYERLVTIQTQLEGEEDPRTLAALNNLGSQLSEMGRPEEALPILERALDIKRRVLPSGHPSLVASLSSLARTLELVGEPGFAEELYDEALAEGREALGEGDRRVCIVRLNRARLLMRAGRAAEVLADLEALVPALEAIEQEGSVLLATARQALANCRRLGQ